MAIIKEEETKTIKKFSGTAYTFKLTENQEDSYKNLLEKNPDKAKLKVAQQVQKQMRKHTANIIEGEIFDEDYKEIYEEVIKLLEGK